MTNEEAVKRLEDARCSPYMKEAINIGIAAIKELMEIKTHEELTRTHEELTRTHASYSSEHETHEERTEGDCISRKAAIEYFMINTNWHDEDGDEINDADEKRKLLEDYFSGVPSVNPAKVGHWIEYKYAEESEGHLISNFVCDKCHAWTGADYDYCPNCGAKMEGGKGPEWYKEGNNGLQGG